MRVCFIIYFWLFMVVFLGVCGIAFWLISFLGLGLGLGLGFGLGLGLGLGSFGFVFEHCWSDGAWNLEIGRRRMLASQPVSACPFAF